MDYFRPRLLLNLEICDGQVTATIRESKTLKDLQIKVAREEMERTAQRERNDLFQKLVDTDPMLANLLTGIDPVIRVPAGGGTDGNEEGKGEFEGKYCRLIGHVPLLHVPTPRTVTLTERITPAE